MGLPGRAPAGSADVGMQAQSGFVLIFSSETAPLLFPPTQRYTEHVNLEIPAAWSAKAQA